MAHALYQEAIEEMKKLISPGKKLKTKNDGYLYHILGIFDDMVAVKYYGVHKKRWFYEFTSLYWYYLLKEDGKLIII